MLRQPYYKKYGYTKYNCGCFRKPESYYNCRKIVAQYHKTKRNIQKLIDQLPGFSIMATLHKDNASIEPPKKDREPDEDEFVSTDRPTCKSLQKDLEKVHTIVWKVKGNVSRLLTGLDEIN